MNEHMQAILKSKRRERNRLVALSFSEKLVLLEKLRDRALAIEDSARYRNRGTQADKAWVVRETTHPIASGEGTVHVYVGDVKAGVEDQVIATSSASPTTPTTGPASTTTPVTS